MENVDTLILGGTVLCLDETMTRIEDGALAIAGDAIAAVGTEREFRQRFTSRNIVDGKHSLILPGLVNSHTHAAMTCFRGIADDMALMDWLGNYIFPAEARNVDPELVYWGSLLACAEMIKSGTTTFCDMYIFEEETARAAREAGMRCLLGEVLFDFPSPNVKTPQEGLAYTRKLLYRWSGDPLVRIAVEPHALYTCSRSLLLEAGNLATEYQVPLALHLLENSSEKKQLQEKLGQDALSCLRELGLLNERLIAFHCVCLDDEDIETFRDEGCKAVYNPESNMKLASGFAPVSRMLREGICVGLGTDGCASNNNLDMFQEMDTAAKLEKVRHLDPTLMPAETVVRMATCQGARVLGMDGITGCLKAGMKADFILIDLNRPHLTPMYNPYSHLVYTVNGSDVKTVFINGKMVMKDRQLLTFNEEECMQQVRRIAERVRESLKEPV
ncbi:MAG: 5-methylthioadenosine/S-adenosylhomocysteine deaminase [Syntrophus sp. PtaB.Bin075]|nr:MAG: 5-methylthioadenosine/S-adenosylhomocysteine deaminase [Syntrophus sp. PtaB.Bin075]